MKVLRVELNLKFSVFFLDFLLESATFVCISNANGDLSPCSAAQPSYCVRRQSQSIVIESSEEGKHDIWLQDTLLPKLIRWASETRASGEGPHGYCLAVDSHSLIDAEAYNVLYNQLKLKYGVQMVERWPEQTDAAKFVYEDVAIATYLLVLWRQERQRTNDERLQSFVDLGCGNGLLVFILSSEGHPGLGIDLRKRGIWETYPESTKLSVNYIISYYFYVINSFLFDLQIQAIIPSDSCLFPNFDWIIGNHSDELSPWLPVIAARSSPTARYFVLPCCAFEFSGSKFQRRNAHDSQYNDFVRYVQTVSDACGFVTQMDRLKIPSTKRVCLIGSTRNTSIGQFAEQCLVIQDFIDSQTKKQCSDPAVAWSDGFAARSDVEPVRNCSKIDRGVQDEIVKVVFDHLLAKRRCIEGQTKIVAWNAGGQAALGELAQLVSSDSLRKLKSECGGLQTLLKNNHQIFQVIKGTVQVRSPVPYSQRLKDIQQRPKKKGSAEFVFKQKRCWFLDNHPDGCPFDAIECSFSHSTEQP